MDAQLQTQYDEISNQFFDCLYSYWSPHATRQGFHQYDHTLGNYNKQEIQKTLQLMKILKSELELIDPLDLPDAYALDYQVLKTRMNREIFWIEKWRFWERNPEFYLNIITEGIFNLISRNFAPPENRLVSLLSRITEIPEVLVQAKENLKNPPIEYTNLAIQHIPGAVSFLGKIEDEFANVQLDQLKRQLSNKLISAVDAVKQFGEYLEKELKQESLGSFQIGKENVQEILDAEEMIDVPVDQILSVLYRDLELVELEIKETARLINAAKPVEEVVSDLRSVHSKPDGLKMELEDECKRIRGYLSEFNFITIPAKMPDVIVEPMPDYASGGGMMLTPGPFEETAPESYLKLQIPKPDWTQERLNGLWSDFNHYALVLLVIHECYPGHHTQFYLQKRLNMRASKDHDSDSNSDGWAEYAKFEFVEKVLAPMDMRYQLAALLSKKSYIAAGIAGLEIHLNIKSLEEASAFLVDKQGRTRENTYIWVLNRAMAYPTHLTYYIGSKMVAKLRDDYKSLKGKAFNLKAFHDEFMTYGLIPIKLIRQQMLGDFDDGVLFK